MSTYDGAAAVAKEAPEYHNDFTERTQPAQEWCILRQCPRCLGRMTGPLAGVVAPRLLPDYDQSSICTACQAELGIVPPRRSARRRRDTSGRRSVR